MNKQEKNIYEKKIALHKAIEVIESCKTKLQLDNAKKFVHLLSIQYVLTSNEQLMLINNFNRVKKRIII